MGSNLLSLGVFLYSRKAPYFGDCTAVPVKSTLEVNMVRHVVSALLLLTATSFSSTAQALAVNSPGTLSDHNSTVPLPIVVREAGIGGDNNDAITCIKRRFDGKYLVGGWTSSAAIEGLLPGMASARDGAAEDGFVALLSADLASVEYVHFISATKDERVTAIDILPNGKVCVVGQTNSTDFPVKGASMLQQRGSGVDAFVVILSADLHTQHVGMLLPGNADDVATGVAINKQGNIVVVGTTSSTNPFQAMKVVNDTARGGTDGFVYVLNSGLSYAEFFSFLGGSANDSFTGVALDKTNGIVISGITSSQDYYTFPKKIRIPIDDGGGKGEEGEPGEGGYKEVGKDPYSHVFNGGSTDALVAKFTSGGELVYSTYFGGSGNDAANGLVITPDDGAFIVGTTSSPNLPTESSTTLFGGQTDGFAAVITSDGLRLSGAAYVGGAGADAIATAVSNGTNMVTVLGSTATVGLPTIGVGATPITQAGTFVAKLSTTQISYLSSVQTNGTSTVACAAFDEFQDVIMGGTTLPTQMPMAGEPTTDAFVGKYAFGSLAYRSITPSGMICAGKPVTIQWTAQGFNGEPLMTVDVTTDGGKTLTVLGKDIKSRQLIVTLPESIPLGSACLFRIQTNRGHMVASSSPIIVGLGPSVIEQPQSVVSCPAKDVTITLVLSDTTTTIQWRKDGVVLVGQTLPTLTLTSVKQADAGVYDAVLGNGCGNATTNGATLTIATTPIIDKQPANQEVEEGTTATFTFIARGSDLTFQWLRNDVEIAGATSMFYQISNVSGDDVGYYSCRITSSCGSVTTEKVMLTLKQTTDVVSTWLDGTALRLFPQPATNQLSLEVPALGEQFTIVINSIQGVEQMRLVVPASVAQQLTTMNVSTLPAGNYILQCLTSKNIYATQFVVVR